MRLPLDLRYVVATLSGWRMLRRQGLEVRQYELFLKADADASL